MVGKVTRRQQIHASNRSANISEALSARVKDPLWFLARQWQTGEFEAENGGKLGAMHVESRHHGFSSVNMGTTSRPISRHDPLEAVVEAETMQGDAPAWRSEAQEYGFELASNAHKLRADSYRGHGLDWYDFAVTGLSDGRASSTQAQQLVPTQLYFKGAPDPRWWRMEDGDAYFDSPEDPEPNVLSVMLPEFFYTDVNNWYVIPSVAPSGSVREITKLTVTDSFGVTTEIDPVDDPKWRVFAIDAEKAGEMGISGSAMMLPNVAVGVLHNDPIEEVRFVRDEQANLVWAWETLYRDENGNPVNNGDGVAPVGLEGGGSQDDSGFPFYRLSSETRPYWIPYVPRHKATNGGPQGEVYLKRGRTVESATPANPQYKSTVVAEADRLHEEEVPMTGLRVRRIARFARGSDGKPHFWVGRHRDAGRGSERVGLKFDYLDE